jgi:hypothetical protein
MKNSLYTNILSIIVIVELALILILIVKNRILKKGLLERNLNNKH